MMNWNEQRERLCNIISTLHELISIRDRGYGYQSCIGITRNHSMHNLTFAYNIIYYE